MAIKVRMRWISRAESTCEEGGVTLFRTLLPLLLLVLPLKRPRFFCLRSQYRERELLKVSLCPIPCLKRINKWVGGVELPSVRLYRIETKQFRVVVVSQSPAHSLSRLVGSSGAIQQQHHQHQPAAHAPPGSASSAERETTTTTATSSTSAEEARHRNTEFRN